MRLLSHQQEHRLAQEKFTHASNSLKVVEQHFDRWDIDQRAKQRQQAEIELEELLQARRPDRRL